MNTFIGGMLDDFTEPFLHVISFGPGGRRKRMLL